MLLLSVSLPGSQEKCVCAHIHTHIFLYLAATVTESSEVTLPCQINDSLRRKMAGEVVISDVAPNFNRKHLSRLR